ncbi:D-Ala-D-Ala carboxypeptidase family metallohydrolase [Pseudomonas sp. R5(2019)]|uniref:D-Ala-D-Ala carboxypeptidase family metallohydrolase n=1 Tax=Pseudomonas sp. R5(2019) TaxID=2697566 RepID=UPI0015B4E1A5|nr:D-Ala-D-Ala carboxypeptidase family metallohydrolase [Pseudomonas sp. R5(2019)]
MKPALIAALLLVGTVAVADERDPAMFEQWARAHDTQAFIRFLRANAVDNVVPLFQLLRSASDWQTCNAEPFATPPEPLWPSVLSTLKLLQALRAEQILGEFEVVSAYRDPALNRCASGAGNSAHLRAFAVDIQLPDHQDVATPLCTFWAKQGKPWKMGVSRYASGRIHIDTAGYRTWGDDLSSKTSFCLAPGVLEGAGEVRGAPR